MTNNKFNVGDEVLIINNLNGSRNSIGDTGKITETFTNMLGDWYKVTVEGNRNEENWSQDNEIRLIEKVERKITKNQRITALEETVAKQGEEIEELKLIVAQIRKPSTVVEEALANDTIEFEGKQYKKVDREAREGDVIITNYESSFVKANKPYKVARCNQTIYIEEATVDVYNVGRTPETVDVYELMDGYNPGILMVDETPIKTANQLRAEIIEKAKGFIERTEKYLLQAHADRTKGNYLYQETSCTVKFKINEEKRTIVALLYDKHLKEKLNGKGIAKCMLGDVFNEHIGKAIALGRALGLDVSEFEQAVQPTFAVGQKCVIKNWEGHNGNKLIVTKMLDEKRVNHDYMWGWLDDNRLTTINDTDAKYSNEVTK